MAKIERVTVFCDGPCGSNEIEGEGHAFSLRPQGLANRNIDLCDRCAAMFREVYEKGSLVAAGRPRTRRETPARAPRLEPEIIPITSPAASPPMTVSSPVIAEPMPTGSEPVRVLDTFDGPVPADYDPEDDAWSSPSRALRADPEPVVEVPFGTGT